ncbi:hypothetical protein GCM10027184_24330 [Saccharothrix stipae]
MADTATATTTSTARVTGRRSLGSIPQILPAAAPAQKSNRDTDGGEDPRRRPCGDP